MYCIAPIKSVTFTVLLHMFDVDMGLYRLWTFLSGPSCCLSDWLCVWLSVSFVVFHPFSCFASEKTAAVWIGGELNCSVRARSRLSSSWDNEMTINGKAVASRSFVRSLEEQQHGGQTETTAFLTDTGNCPAIVFILNSCLYDVVNPYIIHII